MNETFKNQIFMVTSDQLTELANDIAGKVMAGLSVEPQKKNNVSETEYLSADDVSRLLCVSKPTLWRWEKKEKKLIPLHISGKVVRYRRSDVEKLMSE